MRPVIARVATLSELKTVLTLDDLLDINEALDIDLEMQEYQRKQAESKK